MFYKGGFVDHRSVQTGHEFERRTHIHTLLNQTMHPCVWIVLICVSTHNTCLSQTSYVSCVYILLSTRHFRWPTRYQILHTNSIFYPDENTSIDTTNALSAIRGASPLS